MPAPSPSTANYKLLTSNSSYTFSAKEKDVETGLSYFGARYYSSDLSIWLSVDPMSDKYASLSPYVYCADNPVKLVDPNGEDYETVIDKDSKTITIKAVYYAEDKDKKALQKGVDAWNKQSGKYSLTIENGEFVGTYTINFELTIASVDSKNQPDDGISNSFETYTDETSYSGVTNDGHTIRVRQDAPERTIIHEIGHTLGNGEFVSGVMESGGMSDIILKDNVSETLNQSGFKCLGDFWSNQIDNPPSHSCDRDGSLREIIYGTIKRTK
ncbi:MAG: RHS repeat-associated core domain-containing protein [Bacteroidales bacterium]|nr:RHS repeat-associated core domain-containing protein [Bacteroidales bacterium]